MLKRVLLIAVTVTISACLAGPVAPGNYAVKNVQSYQEPYDKVWEDVVAWFAKNNIPIKTIEKSSGVIYAESSAFDNAVADCGKPGLPYPTVASRRANFNVFISHSGNEPTVRVNTEFTETRHAGGANFSTFPCNSKGVLEDHILSLVSPSAAPPPPSLGVGTKLFTKDGAPFGFVMEMHDSTVRVSLAKGGATTITREQALSMMQK